MIAAVSGSLFWSLLQKQPVVRLLLGCENAEKIYNKLLQIKLVAGLQTVYLEALAILHASIAQYISFFKKENKLKRKHFKCAVAFIVATAMLCGGIAVFGKIEATFPYRGVMVDFKEGWLEQSGSEPYRWFKKQAVFEIFLTKQDMLKLSGYIPENIENVSYLSLKINGTEAFHQDESKGQAVEIQLDISKYVRPFRKNLFEIQTDGVRVPEKKDADQRSFSMFVQRILVY